MSKKPFFSLVAGVTLLNLGPILGYESLHSNIQNQIANHKEGSFVNQRKEHNKNTVFIKQSTIKDVKRKDSLIIEIEVLGKERNLKQNENELFDYSEMLNQQISQKIFRTETKEDASKEDIKYLYKERQKAEKLYQKAINKPNEEKLKLLDESYERVLIIEEIIEERNIKDDDLEETLKSLKKKIEEEAVKTLASKQENQNQRVKIKKEKAKTSRANQYTDKEIADYQYWAKNLLEEAVKEIDQAYLENGITMDNINDYIRYYPNEYKKRLVNIIAKSLPALKRTICQIDERFLVEELNVQYTEIWQNLKKSFDSIHSSYFIDLESHKARHKKKINEQN